MAVRRLMKKATWGIAGAAALGAAALGVVQLSPLSTANATEGADVLSKAEAEAVSSVFADQQTPEDRLPGFLLGGSQKLENLVPTSTRLLGLEDGTKAWTALNTRGEACLISLLPGDDEWASMTCATPAIFKQQALSLQSATGDAESRLYFIPEGYDAPSELSEVAPQLYSGDPSEAETEPVTLTKEASKGARSATTTPNTIDVPPFESVDELLK